VQLDWGDMALECGQVKLVVYGDLFPRLLHHSIQYCGRQLAGRGQLFHQYSIARKHQMGVTGVSDEIKQIYGSKYTISFADV
jgi:hypothetical protein